MTDEHGSFEHGKFAAERRAYRATLTELLSLEFEPSDYIHHFPAFAGHLTLARFLSLYEAYKMTLGLAGHIAEIGVFKAAGSLLFGKLLKIFEPQSLSLVHGFDWFRGAKTTEEELHVADGECRADETKIRRLVACQGMDSTVHLHNLDVAHDLDKFFADHSHLLFRLVLVDCGVHDVVSASISQFWPRLTPGGVMIFDHYSHEFAPGEARAVRELLPGVTMRSFPFGWMPSAYVVKPEEEQRREDRQDPQ